MALVIDPTDPDFNALVSLDDANTYFEGRLYADAWTNANNQERETAIIMATRIIRQDVTVGSTIDSGLADACAEYAFQLLKQDRTEDGPVLDSLKVGPLDMSMSGSGGSLYPSIVQRMLLPFFDTPGRSLFRT